jgi:DNA (cytosine-5)-methyltransferase 1
MVQAVELFSCAGGMAEGFRRAGIGFAVSYDKDRDACASYAHNLRRSPVRCDVHDLLRTPPVAPLDLVVADPPCTPWSRGGKREGLDDPRDCLVVTRDLILAWRPRAYLIGNVPGLDDARHLDTLRELFAPLRAAGYCVADFARLDAADYGVPQHRVRPFWFGHRGGPCITWPQPTHCDPRKLATAQLFGVDALAPWVTCRDALSALAPEDWGKPLHEHRSHPKHQPSNPDAPSQTITASDGGGGSRTLAWPRRSEALFPWVTVRQALDILPRDEWGEPLHGYRVHARHRPSQPDAPSHTVTARQHAVGADILEWPWGRPSTTVCCDPRIPPPGHHGGTGYHSSPNAIRLSEKAAAILQGFPESWVFCGRSRKVRWAQIGQAMPPGLAEAVARSVRGWFANTGITSICERQNHDRITK